MNHPLEYDLLTKYGVRRVTGLFAIECRRGNETEVRKEVEAMIERREQLKEAK